MVTHLARGWVLGVGEQPEREKGANVRVQGYKRCALTCPWWERPREIRMSFLEEALGHGMEGGEEEAEFSHQRGAPAQLQVGMCSG